MQWVQLFLITASYVVLSDGFSIPFKRFGGSVSPDVGRNVVRLFILVISVYTNGSWCAINTFNRIILSSEGNFDADGILPYELSILLNQAIT